MNPWQLAQQFKAELGRVRWAHGTKALVFGAGSVYVYAGAQPSDEELPPGFPFALVTIDAATPDADDPELLLQSFTVVCAVEVAGDPLGEHAVIGSARADIGTSVGAGVAEVSERVRFALQRLTGADGASIVVSGTGTSAPATLGRGRHIAAEEFKLTALCTSQPVFAAPDRFRLNGGVFSWRGNRCTERFDFVRYRVGYVSGANPPATAQECAGIIYTGTNTEVHAPAAAGRAYAVFAEYDARGSGATLNITTSDGREVGAFVTT